SPSTGRADALSKLPAYFRVLSIAHYLIVDPDSPLVIHHARSEGETLLTRIIRDGDIMLDPPGLTISMSDIYPPEESHNDRGLIDEHLSLCYRPSNYRQDMQSIVREGSKDK